MPQLAQNTQLRHFCRMVDYLNDQTPKGFCRNSRFARVASAATRKLNDLRQPQLGKNLNNWTKNFELRQPQLEKIGKNN